MAKASPSTIETPGMSSNTTSSAKKSSISAKPPGKQTTLFGFFSKANGTPNQTPAKTSEKRVEARPKVPLTPLPSSEIGNEESPIRLPSARKAMGIGGLRTPETPVAERHGNEMDVESQTGSAGSRKVNAV